MFWYNLLNNEREITVITPIIGIGFIILERIIPDQVLLKSKNWYVRVLIVNLLQLAIVILASFTWDIWFLNWQLFTINSLPSYIEGFFSYVIVTFIFYFTQFST